MKSNMSSIMYLFCILSLFAWFAFLLTTMKEKEATPTNRPPQSSQDQNVRQEHIMFTIPVELTEMVMGNKNSSIIIDLTKAENLTITNPKYTTIAQRIHALCEEEKLFGVLSDSEKKELESLQIELKTIPAKMALIFCQIRPGKTIEDVETYLAQFGGRIVKSRVVELNNVETELQSETKRAKPVFESLIRLIDDLSPTHTKFTDKLKELKKSANTLLFGLTDSQLKLEIISLSAVLNQNSRAFN